jgi:hypothetical protein
MWEEYIKVVACGKKSRDIFLKDTKAFIEYMTDSILSLNLIKSNN